MRLLLDNLDPLRTSDGEVLADAYVDKNFVRNKLGLDPQELWTDLRTIEVEPVLADQSSCPEIEYDPFKARIIPGNHHALQYRGNALTRHKIWFQTNIQRGYLKYFYTGWQQMIALAQCDITAMPQSTQKLLKSINDLLPKKERMNHGIFTLYKDGNDCIGAHSDKLSSFQDGSWFIIIKLGAARYFDFLDLEGKMLFHERLPAGTAVIVKSNTANQLTKHAVPPMKGLAEESGSLVFRRIAEMVPWEVQKKCARAARAAKLKKRRAKMEADEVLSDAKRQRN